MNRKRAVFLAVIAVSVVLAICYLWRPSSVPAGQAPLTALSKGNFGDFATIFDAAAEVPRLVLLLSPT
jgi:hypothetical protein